MEVFIYETLGIHSTKQKTASSPDTNATRKCATSKLMVKVKALPVTGHEGPEGE